jgi:hypothetical protein
MGKIFQDIEELQEWCRVHKDDGLVNGQAIASPHSQQIRDAWIPKPLYDRTLVTATSLGFRKTDVAKCAFVDFALIKDPNPLFSTCGNYSEIATPTRNYRFSLPQELLFSVSRFAYNHSEMTAIALRLWCDKLEGYLEQWLFDQGRKFGLTRAELIELIYTTWLNP